MSGVEKKAFSAYYQKKYPQALRAFIKLEQAQPQRDDTYIYIANCFDSLGRQDCAIKYYKKSLKEKKSCDVAAVNLAIIYYEAKKFRLAKKYAQKSLDYNPQNISALSLWGNIFYYQKNTLRL